MGGRRPRRNGGHSGQILAGPGGTAASLDRSLSRRVHHRPRLDGRRSRGSANGGNRQGWAGVRVDAVSLAPATVGRRDLARSASGTSSVRHLPAAAPARPRPQALLAQLAPSGVSTRSTRAAVVSDRRRRGSQLRRPPSRRPGAGRSETVAAGSVRPSRSPLEPALRDRVRTTRPPRAELPTRSVRHHRAQRLRWPVAAARNEHRAVRLSGRQSNGPKVGKRSSPSSRWRRKSATPTSPVKSE